MLIRLPYLPSSLHSGEGGGGTSWEELGLVCTLGIVVCFLLMFVWVSWRLRQTPKLYEYLLVMGALLFVCLQAIINMGVVTGSMPTKGKSLPFISYGRSAMVVNFIALGLCLSAVRQSRRFLAQLR